jgi:hypothetical protein
MSAAAKLPPEHDPVDNPVHYKSQEPEPIGVIEALGLGPEFHIGTAIKYVSRQDLKGAQLEDLRKANWYIERAVDNYKPKPYKMAEAELDSIGRSWKLHPNLAAVLKHLVDGRWTAAHLMLGLELQRVSGASQVADNDC